MSLFHIIEDATVVLRTKSGVYRQAKVYSRGEHIYAGLGSGFVRLFREGTSCPHIAWSDLDGGGRVSQTQIGHPRFLALQPTMKEIVGGVTE